MRAIVVQAYKQFTIRHCTECLATPSPEKRILITLATNDSGDQLANQSGIPQNKRMGTHINSLNRTETLILVGQYLLLCLRDLGKVNSKR